MIKDGLYRVITKYLCAGFVVQDGKVTNCAPILKKKIDYWTTIAQLVDDEHHFKNGYQG